LLFPLFGYMTKAKSLSYAFVVLGIILVLRHILVLMYSRKKKLFLKTKKV